MALIKTFTEWKKTRDENKALERKKEAKQKYTTAISELLKEFEVEAVHELPSDKRKDFFEKLDSMLGENQQIREAYELAFDRKFNVQDINESTKVDEAVRVGSGSPQKILKELEDYGWEYDKRKKIAYKVFDTDDDDNTIEISIDGDYVEFVIYDYDDNVVDEGDFDAEGLSAGEIDGEVWYYVEESDKTKLKKSKKVSEKKVECPKCEGEGCEHCDGKGYHMVEESKDVDLQRDVVLFVINNEPAYKKALAAGKKDNMEKAVKSTLFPMYKKENNVSSIKLDSDDVSKIASELMQRLDEEINEKEIVDIFLDTELSEEVTNEKRDILRNILLTFENVDSISDVTVDENGNANIFLANEVVLTLENAEQNYWLSNEENDIVIETSEGDKFLKDFYTIFGKALVMNEAEIKPNPKMDDASKKIYNAVSKAIKAPKFDEDDKKSDDEDKHSGEKKSEDDLVGESKFKKGDKVKYKGAKDPATVMSVDDSKPEVIYTLKWDDGKEEEAGEASLVSESGKYSENKDEEIQEMYEGLMKTEKYKEMEESKVKKVAEMMYEMKYGMMEAGCSDVKEMYESSCNEGKYKDKKVEGAVMLEGGKIDVDGDGKADLSMDEMKHKKIAEMLKEMFKEESEESVDESEKMNNLIKEFQKGDMSLQEFQEAVASIEETVFEEIEINEDYLTEANLDKMKKDADKIKKNIEMLKKKAKKDNSESMKAKIAAEEEKLKRVANAIRQKRANESNVEINEEEIDNEKDFKEYATKVLKQAFGDEYDEERANSVINGLINKYGKKGDWGAAVGALQSGLDD